MTCSCFYPRRRKTGREGWPYCARTTDGGKSWEKLGWIGQEPPEGYGYAIMPSTVRLDSGAFLSMIRRAGTFDGKKEYWIEAFLSPDEGKRWYMLKEPHIEKRRQSPQHDPAARRPHRVGVWLAARSIWHPRHCFRGRRPDLGQGNRSSERWRQLGSRLSPHGPNVRTDSLSRCITLTAASGKERHIAATIWDPGTPGE